MATDRVLTYSTRGKKDEKITATVKWNTGCRKNLVYDEKAIFEVYDKYLEPNLRGYNWWNRYEIEKVIVSLLRTGKFDTEQKLVNLFCALRYTIIESKFSVDFGVWVSDEWNKNLFWNIVTNINRNYKQTNKYIYITILDYNLQKKEVCPFGCEADERIPMAETKRIDKSEESKKLRKIINDKKKNAASKEVEDPDYEEDDDYNDESDHLDEWDEIK